MGNSESQYSVQGTQSQGSHSLSDVKQKSCSLKIHSGHSKEEKPWTSPRWARTNSSTSYKSRSLARNCLSQCKSNPPYSSKHGDVVLKTSKSCGHLKQRTGLCGDYCQANNNTYMPDNGYHYVGIDTPEDYRGCNGHILSCYDIHDSMSLALQAEERKSPKVLIKTLGKLDSCLRVEFHNNSGNSMPSDDSDGPVQLLRYSPAMETKNMLKNDSCRNSGMEFTTSRGLSTSDSGLRSSKGSSLSSDSSWYDCPWGNGRDINDLDSSYLTRSSLDPSVHGALVPNESGVLFNQTSSFSSLRELYGSDLGGGLAQSRLSDEYIGSGHTLSNRVSFASDIDVPSRVEHRAPTQYSSYTLPCRKSRPLTEDASKKETLKNRMRRISDWTGSLSRKKRKLQEPKPKEASECFDSGIDAFTAETSSPSYPSNTMWSGSSGQVISQRNKQPNAISSDALRQNIYENFMRELDLDRANVEETTTMTGTEDSSSDSLSSLEQLDLLFEKEQGVVRKAGWLFFKPLITLQKEKKLELVNRRKWKQYWVTLKGCTLMFYETYEGNSMEQNTSPRYALFAEDSIVQSVPEHPKKENVFCLSNSLGDVYLFQATSQTDLENWVTAIHSACASLFAKKHGKEDTVRLLKSQTKSLMQKVDMDSKMKKMAELQLSIVSDPKNRKAIENQIQQWEQNLEKFNMDLFRMRCYLASLQGGELPNPKSLLAAAGRPSKLALGRLGIFSVSSFHALICSRDESALRKRTFSITQKVQIKKSLFSSLKGIDTLARKGKEKRPSVTQIFDTNSSQSGSGTQIPPNLSGSSENVDELNIYNSIPEDTQKERSWEIPIFIHFYDNHDVTVNLRPEHRVEDILNLACKVRQLDPSFFALHLRKNVDENIEYYLPSPADYMQDQVYDELEIFPLGVYNIHLLKTGSITDFGFAVAAQVDEHNSLTHIYVSFVHPDGLAYREGLRTKNEILYINSEAVVDLDLRKMELLFSERSVLLSLRNCQAESKSSLSSSWSENYKFNDQMRPLPPLNQSQLLEEFLDNFRRNSMKDLSNVPDVAIGNLKRSNTDDALDQVQCRPRMDHTYKSADQISALCQSMQEVNQDMMDAQNDSPEPLRRPLARHLSDADRLRKVIQELVDTEKSYVKDLSCLFELYLDPLQNETFLTQDEMESLFGSLPEMLDFQKVFLQTLEDGISSAADFNILETPSQFRKLLFSLGGSFLYYADHFKLYSGFCANHIKVQKVLERARTDAAFKEFLDARNPTKQHSSTLESYLIKPVQRVLKYPLLLKELVSLTDNDSEEHYHLTEALKAMEKVASHINEMQKIYEDYGTVFDQLVAEQSGSEKEVTELSMGELLVYSTVTWLNIFPSLGKTRKELELTAFVFRRAVILVHKENFKLKKKTSQNTRASQIYSDIDQFKFRWLIPLSALQVRMGNAAGTENNCMWELIHTKSEVQGRPETVFQLCSSDCESKTSTIKVIRSILRENLRRHIKCDLPFEKTYKDKLVPLRNRVPVSAKLASTRSLKVLKHSSSTDWNNSMGKGNCHDSDDGSLSSGTHSSGCPTIESFQDLKGRSPVKPLQTSMSDLPNTTVKESDILSDDDEDYRLANLTKDSTSIKSSPTQSIEVQFQNLNISELANTESKNLECNAPDREGNFQQKEHPKLVRGHFCPIKRKVFTTKPDKAITKAMKDHHQSLDNQSDASIDLNAILEREFSIQSLTSVVNEDCFYETAGKCGKS